MVKVHPPPPETPPPPSSYHPRALSPPLIHTISLNVPDNSDGYLEGGGGGLLFFAENLSFFPCENLIRAVPIPPCIIITLYTYYFTMADLEGGLPFFLKCIISFMENIYKSVILKNSHQHAPSFLTACVRRWISLHPNTQPRLKIISQDQNLCKPIFYLFHSGEDM